MKNKLFHHTRGFTIIEMMIATAVFSVILLLCSFAIINLGRTYQKGITTSRTQETAREIMENITDSIRFGGGGILKVTKLTGGEKQAFCVGTTQFSYVLGAQLVEGTPGVGQANKVMKSKNKCSESFTLDEGQEMMRLRMRLERLEVEELADRPGAYRVLVRVIAGEDDLLEKSIDGDYRQCKNLLAGGEYCAMSELSTIIERRI